MFIIKKKIQYLNEWDFITIIAKKNEVKINIIKLD